MGKLSIQYKKGKDNHRHSVRLERPDGSSEWACVKGLVYHDLAHYVVESYFQLKRGFYGEILQGTSMDTLAASGVVQSHSWHSDIFVAETLVGTFQIVLQLEEGFAEFTDRLLQREYFPEVKMPSVEEKDFIEVSLQVNHIWKEWDQIAPGESLWLGFSLSV